MNKKGFTLIELLVVIAIIGLLSTLAVVALGGARTQSRDAKRASDIKQIATALELYFAEHGRYPTSTTAINLGDTNYACLGTAGFSTTGCAGAHMERVPQDPTNGQNYTYTSTNTQSYIIDVSLEGSIDNGNYVGNVRMTPSGFIDVSG